MVDRLDRRFLSNFFVLCVGGNDGMVVSDLAIVEYLLAFFQFATSKWSCEQGIVGESLEDIRHFFEYIVAQIGGIHARIGGDLLLIQRLDGA